MRVTNKMLSYNFLKDMRNNLNNMQKLQDQLTSGKEIRKPSDNPFKVARTMQLHTDISSNKQYNENIKDTISFLDATDTALGQAGDVLQRVRELLVSAGNAGYGETERKAIKDEINEKISEFSQIINTNFDGKYVFGGTRATTKPVDVQKDVATGNVEFFYGKRNGGKLNTGATATADEKNELANISSKLTVEVSQGVTMEYNVSANEVLEFGAGSDLRTIFGNILMHLDGKDEAGGTAEQARAKITSSDLQNITDTITNILKLRSEVGARQNRMDSAKDRNIDENFNMTEVLSKTEDIDITEKTMEYSTMQTVYVASLQTSAKIIQPSLMDYLR